MAPNDRDQKVAVGMEDTLPWDPATLQSLADLPTDLPTVPFEGASLPTASLQVDAQHNLSFGLQATPVPMAPLSYEWGASAGSMSHSLFHQDSASPTTAAAWPGPAAASAASAGSLPPHTPTSPQSPSQAVLEELQHLRQTVGLLRQEVELLRRERDALRPAGDPSSPVKIRSFLQSYAQAFHRANSTKRPTRALSLVGTPHGLGGCAICGTTIVNQLFEILSCGHVVCGSSSLNRGGCGAAAPCQAHKKQCTGGPVVSFERRIKVHGMYRRNKSIYQHIELSTWSQEDIVGVESAFSTALHAFLKYHRATGTVSVAVRDGCIELVAKFQGRGYDAAIFDEFFSDKANTLGLFPPGDFSLNVASPMCMALNDSSDSCGESDGWSSNAPSPSCRSPGIEDMDTGDMAATVASCLPSCMDTSCDEPTVRTSARLPDALRLVDDSGSPGSTGGEVDYMATARVSQVSFLSSGPELMVGTSSERESWLRPGQCVRVRGGAFRDVASGAGAQEHFDSSSDRR